MGRDTDNRTIVSGILTACDWDVAGRPIELKVCAEGEIDYIVKGRKFMPELRPHLHSWVQLGGEISFVNNIKYILVDRVIKIEERKAV